MALTLQAHQAREEFVPAVRLELVEGGNPRARSLQRLHALTHGLKGKQYLLMSRKLNDIYDINAHIAELNSQLATGQYLIGSADFQRGYKYPVFYGADPIQRIILRPWNFLVHRVLPKLPYTGRVYNFLTNGRGKRMCKTEILGRLAYGGFAIEKVEEAERVLYFRVYKKSEPLIGQTPSYGPLIQLKRVVKGGRIAGIYKMRTMHPYAEFIQDYVYELNELEDGGKIKDDFRVSREGKLFRKIFLDELPMLINLIKGDIKLVGVRPLSQHYFSLYTEAMQRRRIRHKPGLLPPFYSEEEKPSTLEDVMVSEMKYLIQYEKHPWKTDVKYFWKIMNNLVRKKLRSK